MAEQNNYSQGPAGKIAALLLVLLVAGVSIFYLRLMPEQLPVESPSGLQEAKIAEADKEETEGAAGSTEAKPEAEAAASSEASAAAAKRKLVKLRAPQGERVADIIRTDSVTPPITPDTATHEPPRAIAAADRANFLAIVAKMDLSEKAIVARTIAKLSPSEILEIYRLYKQGSSEAYRNLDEILMQKMSDEDFERLRALAAKYGP
ncbi:MAG: hypothetical protein GX060_03720 [Firmicutes bacterium]|nr:hypothetical protein [Bacillota bacterium]